MENIMVELDSVITNGYVAPDTIGHFQKRGYTFVCTIPANLVHPHSLPTDKLTIFSKYTEPDMDEYKTLEGHQPTNF